MPTVNVVDQNGHVRETLDLSAAVFGAPVNGPLLHQAVVRELAGRRAGTHDTKGRSVVSGGTAKPWRQKGTGRARAGSSRSPIWTGGGTVFGPSPRSYVVKVNRKARRAALRAALSDTVGGGRVTVVDALPLTDAKTKTLVAVLGKLGIAAHPTLLVVGDRSDALQRASRNVPWLRVVGPRQVSVAELLRYQHVVFDRQAMLAVQEALET
jgi:large subunit ribosomal protein L4